MTPTFVANSGFAAAAPLLVLTFTGFAVIGVSLFLKRIDRQLSLILALVALAAAAIYSSALWGDDRAAFGGFLVADNFGLSFNVIFALSAALSLLLSSNRYEDDYLLYPEFNALILFATVGMMLMTGSTNLLTIFLGLELLSISLYILAGFKRSEGRSLEAAFKYFLLGAFSSAFLLYGIAFLFGATGSLDLQNVGSYFQASGTAGAYQGTVGVLLIFVGLAFKLALVPFHMWAPDVYQGAPTPVSAFMATASKAAAAAVLLRFLHALSGGVAVEWEVILWVIAVLSMTLGNVAALVQKNLKRMLAYSSIAHAGYILVGILSLNELGAASVVFYLLVYAFMNIGAFGFVCYFSGQKGERLELADYRGLARRSPWLAIIMSVFMFSLAGLPPTSGFVGKFYLFSAAVNAGHIWLVILGVVNSMISLYYYLGVVVIMFMKEPNSEPPSTDAVPIVSFSLAFTALATLGIGLFPSRLMEQFQQLVTDLL